MADAALQIAAEDDALVTHSPVALPVGEFKKRISRLASDLGHRVLPELPEGARHPEAVLKVRRHPAARPIHMDSIKNHTSLQWL